MKKRKPRVGEIVLYLVGATDSPALRSNSSEGTLLPAIVLRVWTDECVQLQVFCDGPAGCEWRTSIFQGVEACQWQFRPEEV